MAHGEGLTATQRSLLSRATSATSEPTPGYVYKDITDMVVMNIAVLPAVEDYLLQKLMRAEPYIKYKCLKLLKNLCLRLPHEFNRNKVCQSYAVLECRGYKAPHSEYNGDYLCQMVRNEVEDLLKAVYERQNGAASAPSTAVGSQEPMIGFGNAAPPQSMSGGRGFATSAGPTGFGNSNSVFQPAGVGNAGGFGNNASFANNMAFGSSVGRPKMEGFGNFVPPTTGSKSTGSQAIKALTDAATKYLSSSSLFGKIEKMGSTITNNAMENIEKYLATGNDHQRQTQPTVTPNWFNHEASKISIASTEYSNRPIKMERSLLPSLIEDTNLQRSAVDDISGESESKLVKDILTFSGIKVTPSQQVIDDFLLRVKEVNVRYVIDELLQNLNNRANKWQLQLRILCIFEALIMRGHMTADVLGCLKAQLEPILIKCREEGQLKNKAERLMQLLKTSNGSSKATDTLIDTVGDDLFNTRVDKAASNTLDMFSDVHFKKQEPPSLNVPSDFNNPAFDLMDSFTPVSSVPSPMSSMRNEKNKSEREDDIFDFDKLAIGTVNAQSASQEKDLFDVLDTISFHPPVSKNEDLI
ncbi:AP-4 complex accessory subunit tepsin like protein [Babesia gibsoni]|uniref:AP-4 complex accessory subunit tepsin like protein n=1 Tax=Babesia gibsoni TaxID=33632 RepID=A0AAD8PET4_BABGI|nr:AP-4 complex accessory subunit tepsin like protein [Babesia gibsoni]